MKQRTSRQRLVLTALLIASSFCISLAQQSPSPTPTENEQKWATVKGAVNAPMRVALRRPIRLSEILVMAGGLKENAKDTILITHSDRTTATFNLRAMLARDDKSNPYILGGDIVTVAD